MSKNLFLSFPFFLFSNRKERERKTVTWEKEGERVRSLEGEEEEASFSTLLFFSGMQHQGEKKVPLTFLAGGGGDENRSGRRGAQFQRGERFRTTLQVG